MDGATVGVLKFRYVGLRDLYGDGKIGLEIRGGWSQKWDKLRSPIERLTQTLGRLDSPVSIKHSRPPDSKESTLLEHDDFNTTRAPLLEAELANTAKGKLFEYAPSGPLEINLGLQRKRCFNVGC